MTNGEKAKATRWAIIALTLIALSGVVAGTVVAALGLSVTAAGFAFVTAAISGIVALVIKSRED